jgi:hypothetical protein
MQLQVPNFVTSRNVVEFPASAEGLQRFQLASRCIDDPGSKSNPDADPKLVYAI